MSMQLIYGRAGSGKSEYCFQEMVELIAQGKKVYMITPEQFSYTAEKKLLAHVKQKAIINAEIITFQRMAYRVSKEMGETNKTRLTKAGKAMAIQNILEKQRKHLNFLGKSEDTIDLLGNTITELKKHEISLQQLEEMQKELPDRYLQEKLKEIHLIYEQYNKNLQEKCIEEDDILTNLAEQLPNTTMFQGAYFFIDEFVGFTAQEYRILAELLKTAKKVAITITLDEFQKELLEIFSSNQENWDRLIEIAKTNNIAIEKPIHLKEIKRFQNKELAHLEKMIYETKYEVYEKETTNISLFLAKNQFSEVEKIAKTIVTLVKEKGYQYKEIAIITKELSTYANLVRVIFAKYELPIFIDEKKELNQNIFVKYLLAILEIFSKNWSYDAVFSYLKLGLTDITKEDIFRLENHCIQWGIRGKKWYMADWDMIENEEEKQVMNTLRKKVVDPLLNFQKKVAQKRDAREITKALYEFLLENQIPEKWKQKVKKLQQIGRIELASEYRVSFEVLIEVFDQIVCILEEEKITFEEYQKILKIGLQNCGLGKIPEAVDAITVGDVERSRTHVVKAVFILGLNDGVFPSVNQKEGFLNDNDRKLLKEHGIELAKGTLAQLYEDNFNIYKAFSIAEEKLFLSYRLADSTGKALRPSTLVMKIKKIFPNLKEQSDMISRTQEVTTMQATFEELLNQIRDFMEGKEIEEQWFTIFQIYQQKEEWEKRLIQAMKALNYCDNAEKLEKEKVEELYGNTLKTSISRLEQYQKCAFSFYLKYGLELSNQTLFKIQSLDTGTLMHDITDTFFDQVVQRKLDLKELTEKEIEEMVQSILNERLTLSKNYIFSSTPKYQLLTRRLKKVIVRSMKYIILSLTESDFSLLGNEVEFRENGKYPPIIVPLENGKKVEIIGKIDRIDIAKNENGNYIRIIDYKSSVKSIDLNEVIEGLQIQLFTYLDAVTRMEEVAPAGVLYFNLIEPIIKTRNKKTNEEIEKEIKKQFRMNGLVLDDVKVVKMMDKGLEKGASSQIPVYLDVAGELSKTRSNTLKQDQFENLQHYMKKLIKQIGEEILSGAIPIKPVYNSKKKKTPCDYCEYKTICNFDQQKNQYHYISEWGKEEILEKIKEKI